MHIDFNNSVFDVNYTDKAKDKLVLKSSVSCPTMQARIMSEPLFSPLLAGHGEPFSCLSRQPCDLSKCSRRYVFYGLAYMLVFIWLQCIHCIDAT